MRRACLIVAAAAVAACGPSKEKEEARVVGAAVEALIAAPNDKKRDALDALDKTPCASDAACEVKNTCVDAFRPLVKALAIKDEIRAAMRAPGAAASTDALRDRVDEADKLVKETATKHDLCLAKKAALLQKTGN